MATTVSKKATVSMDYVSMIENHYRELNVRYVDESSNPDDPFVPRVYLGREAYRKSGSVYSQSAYIIEFFREIKHNGKIYHWMRDYHCGRECIFCEDGRFNYGKPEVLLDDVSVRHPEAYGLTDSNVFITVPLLEEPEADTVNTNCDKSADVDVRCEMCGKVYVKYPADYFAELKSRGSVYFMCEPCHKKYKSAWIEREKQYRTHDGRQKRW